MMVRALIGRLCMHLHAVPVTTFEDPAERMWCPACGAQWSELPRFGVVAGASPTQIDPLTRED